MEFESVIGLEIHARLLTKTKIFCGCSTQFGAKPNTHVCPVCLGLPGALPVLNRRAVDYGIRASLALGCSVQPVSVFARKNYFYPDLPKGYQISQFEEPLAIDGGLEYEIQGKKCSVRITRVHLEEDAGKSLHEGVPDSDQFSYLDFNRSGVPLVEIVTEPDLRSGEAAAEFFSRLRSILLAIGVNDGNMEEGSLKCDANVSVRPVGDSSLGVKVEVKNINSFRFLQRAINHEFERQVLLVQAGGMVVQETRRWDSDLGLTTSMRSKEEAHDYRYFPEPDLPPLMVSEEWIAEARSALPELPEERKSRLVKEYGLPVYDAQVLTQGDQLFRYFEKTATISGNPKAASNWVMGEVMRKINASGVTIDEFSLRPTALAELIGLVEDGKVTRSAAKLVFERMYETGETAEEAVAVKGLAQMDDRALLEAIVSKVIEDQPAAVQSYQRGKTGILGFLIGQVMKESKGAADPKQVNELLRRNLD